jgi:hypothetical protein
LESKAEQRNPDEFYFAMENAKTKDGVHIQRQVQQLRTCWSAFAHSWQENSVQLQLVPAWCIRNLRH